MLKVFPNFHFWSFKGQICFLINRFKVILAAKYLTYADKLYLFINPDGYFIFKLSICFQFVFVFFQELLIQNA